MERYDIVIAGGGLAGLTAALFAARQGHRTLALVAGTPGGHLATVDRIEDFPGFPEGVPGYELCPLVEEQAASAGAAFAMAEVERLSAAGADWRVTTSAGDYLARAVIVATGARFRPLGLPGEERLLGRGISHCASCDGPLLRGQPAAVVGGGDEALHEALTLIEHRAPVHLIVEGEELTGQRTYQERLLARPDVQIHRRATVEALLGDDALAGVRLRETTSGTTTEIAVAGLFVYAGRLPNTEFLQGLLPLDETGHVPTDLRMRTALPGLLAAGDARRHATGQAVAAAGDGATAASAAHQYLLDAAWPVER